MAKKTNKTDHVLNLLSSGKKASREENDAPPVDLRRKAPEPPVEDLTETELPEPKMTPREEDPLPEPRMSDRPQEEPLPEPRMSARKEEQSAAVVGVAAVTPTVSVVHASGGEDSIAEAVKDSLEAEFDEFLKEKNETSGINVFELLGADTEPKEEEAAPVEEPVVEEAAETVAEEPVKAQPAEAPKAAPKEPIKEAAPAEEPVKEEMSAEEPVIEEEPETVEEPVEEQPVEKIVEEIVEEHETETAAEPEETTEEEVTAEEPEEAQAQAESEPPQKEAAQQKEEHMQQSRNEEKDYTTINVMERLVRDQVATYVRQFGHCDCDRCIEDTVALTLTHLPSKYVVVNKAAVSPLLNFYEKKYAGQLIVEITKATMIVNESPHH